MSSALWLPHREEANPTTIRTAFCIVDYLKMKEREKDLAFNTVNMCCMYKFNYADWHKIGLTTLSIDLYCLSEGKVLIRNGIPFPY